MNTNAAKSKNYKEYCELNKAPEIQGWLMIRFKRWEFTSISLTRAPIFLITSSEGIATWLNSLEYYPFFFIIAIEDFQWTCSPECADES